MAWLCALASLAALARLLPQVATTCLFLAAKLEDAVTNEVLCDTSVTNGGIIYGTGTESGNEKGYIVDQSSCGWSADDAPHLETGHLLRSTFVFSASRRQFGMMAYWNLHVVA